MSKYQTRVATLVLMVAFLTLVLPLADAQLIIGERADHKRLEITINEDGTAHVLHEINRASSPVTLVSITGQYENIIMTDINGKEANHAIAKSNDGFSVTIFNFPTNTIIEYDLLDAITRIGAYETWDYYYLESTIFTIPDNVDRIFLNEGSIELVNDVRKIECHGCDALIEYSLSESTHVYTTEIDGTSHDVEVVTVAIPQSIGFDANAQTISMNLDVDDHAFVDIVIPHGLLKGPYEAYYEQERLGARLGLQNSTHTQLELRMPDTGTLIILGNNSIDNNITIKSPKEMESGIIFPIIIIVAGIIGVLVTVFILMRKRTRV